jgi:hypothetical protein
MDVAWRLDSHVAFGRTQDSAFLDEPPNHSASGVMRPDLVRCIRAMHSCPRAKFVWEHACACVRLFVLPFFVAFQGGGPFKMCAFHFFLHMFFNARGTMEDQHPPALVRLNCEVKNCAWGKRGKQQWSGVCGHPFPRILPRPSVVWLVWLCGGAARVVQAAFTAMTRLHISLQETRVLSHN